MRELCKKILACCLVLMASYSIAASAGCFTVPGKLYWVNGHRVWVPRHTVCQSYRSGGYWVPGHRIWVNGQSRWVPRHWQYR